MTENNLPSSESTQQQPAGAAPRSDAPIVAKAGRYYRNARYIMSALFIGFGVMCIYDGFIKWPRENEIARLAPAKQAPPHGDYDILINQVLGGALPPLGLFVVIRALYNSRGRYRLEGGVLSAPGHPPIPLDSLRKIDKRQWEKKGIAYIEYELASGKTGRVKLDDFVYQRDPTDKIFERIEAHAMATQG
jgi:hypothetical protein